VDRIDPLPDHKALEGLSPGDEVIFRGGPWRVCARATLASGEPGLVMQQGNEQCLVSYTRLVLEGAI
jgi:hypothetical protein